MTVVSARQHRKLENIKLDPWPAMWRGKAWHDGDGQEVLE